MERSTRMRFQLFAYLSLGLAWNQTDVFAQAPAPQSAARAACHSLANASVDDSCWFLFRDATHPEGPGHWHQLPCTSSPEGQPSSLGAFALSIIHAGDALLLVERSEAADVRLRAIALEPAQEGDLFHARLRINAKPLQVKALAPGLALLAGRPEEWTWGR